ncbi:MAG: AFG1 family ATPase [Rhodobacteraceae bacterium]|nr:AFG1 family ATPase [Paracoccaceae bacterium]
MNITQTHPGPLHAYRDMLRDGTLNDDAGQRLAVEKLQILHNRLKDYDPVKPKKIGLGIFGWGRENIAESAIPGLYMYGGVGRGKSMLMDLFFENAPIEPKRRVHFHGFMQEVHEGIHIARQHGVKDPIVQVSQRIADSAALLCFDEMQISDIADAMIVGRLFEKLFARGVIIVATSNRHPDDLYKDGLNRQLFVPFIEKIKDKLEVFHISDGDDHRQNRLSGKINYHTPLGAVATKCLDNRWDVLAGVPAKPLTLKRKTRNLVIPAFHNGVARASFADLCGKPLGPGDYLAIADAIRVLILDNIPILKAENQNEAKRFVTLIDALYEAKVRLLCSAAAEPEQLYPHGKGAFEFERTASRLNEMRSEGWAQ